MTVLMLKVLWAVRYTLTHSVVFFFWKPQVCWSLSVFFLLVIFANIYSCPIDIFIQHQFIPDRFILSTNDGQNVTVEAYVHMSIRLSWHVWKSSGKKTDTKPMNIKIYTRAMPCRFTSQLKLLSAFSFGFFLFHEVT